MEGIEVPKRGIPPKEDEDKESEEKQSEDANLDPSAPIQNNGILTSFVNSENVANPACSERIQPAEQDSSGSCRFVSNFEILNIIDEGTWGIIYQAMDTKNNCVVALKKVRINYPEGFPPSVLHEISNLNCCRHENIVHLKEVVVRRDLQSTFLAMEYCEYNLASLQYKMKVHFTIPQVKCIMYQVLLGLRYLHRSFIVHRDLKLSNLLMTDKGCVKIANFGLARWFNTPLRSMTASVIWYRPPEVILRAPLQTYGVDMWAAGCILGELLESRPLLPGQSEIGQLELIVDLLGTPSDRIWPEYSSLPGLAYFTLKQQPYNRIIKRFPLLTPGGLRLLNCLLGYDPKRRVTAEEGLQSSYFKEAPLPCEPKMMGTFPQHRNMKIAGAENSNNINPPPPPYESALDMEPINNFDDLFNEPTPEEDNEPTPEEDFWKFTP